MVWDYDVCCGFSCLVPGLTGGAGAGDGTDIALENSEELKEVFGCSGSKRNAATALGSMVYGPLEQAIYDCQIAPYAADERDLAKLHMKRLLELGLGGSLLLFDRGYPSAAFLSIR